MAGLSIDANVQIDVTRLDRAMREEPGLLQDVLRVGGFNVEARAKQLCPKDTLNLMNSIQTDLSELKDFRVRVSTNVEYAAYQEFGTRFMAAHPYMVPALERERRPLVSAVAQVLKRYEQ